MNNQTQTLPARPSLEQLRNQAKDLKKSAPHPTLADAQLALAVRILRGNEALSTDTQQFMVTSLEDAVRSAREVEQAWQAAQRAYLSAFPPVQCVPTRRGWVCL